MGVLDCIEAFKKTIKLTLNKIRKVMFRYVGTLIIAVSLVACSTNSKPAAQDTPSAGTIHISAEETFKPILEEQIKVFKSSYPNANIIIEYKSEIECLKDLKLDSTRMIFITRGLSKAEQADYKSQIGFNPTFGILAYDAIAILVHQSAKDSLFTLADLRKRLIGENQQQVVMDGNHLTGVVRFLKDSLAKDKPFGKNVMSADGSNAVIEYIKNNPNAIGFVAMNWIGDRYNVKQEVARKYVKTGLLECTLCVEKGLYAQPSQSTIGKGQYSMSLPIYYILKENAPGLGSGLLNFMSLERGQLIFRRSFLVPAKMSFQKRNSLVN
jgi:phosphate transport system substrate-binding protein